MNTYIFIKAKTIPLILKITYTIFSHVINIKRFDSKNTPNIKALPSETI